MCSSMAVGFIYKTVGGNTVLITSKHKEGESSVYTGKLFYRSETDKGEIILEQEIRYDFNGVTFDYIDPDLNISNEVLGKVSHKVPFFG